MLTSPELLSRLQREADFVFAPMTFDSDGIQHNMRLSFPSKLADYTVTGLPLLIWGPEYCSAVRWARDHAPVAEVVASQEMDELNAAVCRLERAAHRKSLGLAAQTVGNRLFSHESCAEIFRNVLLPDRARQQENKGVLRERRA